MPKMRINCPNCRQPIVADIEQVYDVGENPEAKQRLLSGAFNIIQCPHCGYQGNAATPILYHDPEKELLLTFVPPELGLPRDEQERVIGGLIKQVMDRLTPEQRKGYLLRPQSVLTLQGMVERILEGEGITHEMIQAQQQRLSLIQRLLTVSDESLPEVAKEEDEQIDAEFFTLLRRLVEASLMAGDRQSAEGLMELQKKLLPITTFGKEIQEQTQEIESAVADLQKEGEELDREKLLELVLKAPSETRVRAYVSLARPLMDYEFFQLLSERIDRARGEGRSRLAELRDQLLEMTRLVDEQVEARARQAHEQVETILNSDDISEAMAQNLGIVDEFFLQELNTVEQQARKEGDLDKIARIQKMVNVLQEASAEPPEVRFIEELLEVESDEERRGLLEEHSEEVTPEFLNTLSNLAAQVNETENQELAERLKGLNRMALRYSMEKNL